MEMERICMAAGIILFAVPAFSAPEMLDDSGITIQRAAQVEELRAALVATIWGDGGFPSGKLPEVKRGVALPFPELAAIVVAVDELVYALPLGLSSTAYVLHPMTPRNRLAIFHQGHGHELLNAGGEETVRFFLEVGYTVIGMWMPLYGPNKDSSEPPMKYHDSLMERAVEMQPVHPLALFLEPVVAALNHALQDGPREEVVMIGISGGGWTTTLAAALDPRIRISFPVAGTMPLYTRTGGSIGDREQYDENIYRIAGYPDLYVMGSYGAGRKQVQILNHEDPCCFAVKAAPAYVAEVQARVKELGEGEFVFHIDTSHDEHKISAHAIEAFVKPNLSKR
jgi:hypothetical protein